MKTRDYTKLMLIHYNDELVDFIESYLEGIDAQLKENRERGRVLREERKLFVDFLDRLEKGENPKQLVKEFFKDA